MTKEDLMFKTMTEFTYKEIALINYNIYYNSKFIDYYKDFNCGRYERCYRFLKKNRKLLTLKYTPEEYKEQAKIIIKNTKIVQESYFAGLLLDSLSVAN